MRLPNADYKLITEMHAYQRPARSETERAFIERFIVPLGVEVDTYGNHYKAVGNADPNVLWSCHTDSVHSEPGMQSVSYDHNREEIFLPQKSTSSCLGADCAAGVWIMIEMIKAGVPGLYVFHRDEEEGRKGASFIAKDGKLLVDIKSAIAFDRKGKKSIITKMSGQTVCSKAFCESLAKQLPNYVADPNGIWTDTYAYRDLVPECTNLSVGYELAHSPSEYLSLKHLVTLRDAMIKIDTTQFEIVRTPEPEPVVPVKTFRTKRPRSTARTRDLFGGLALQTVCELVREHPFEVGRLLEASGMTFEMLDTVLKLKRIGFDKKMLDLAGDGASAFTDLALKAELERTSSPAILAIHTGFNV